MIFYYNIGLNTCADENWVVDFLMDNEIDGLSREDIIEELHSKHEFFGWFFCEVSNTIEEKFM